jgi:hypothetical protein
MGCCNLLNYVIILLKEKKRKEIRNKTHAHHTYLRTPAALLHGPAAGCCHTPVQLYACTANADGGPLLVLTTALLPSACVRPVYLSEREPRALRACVAAAVRTRVLPLCRQLKHAVLSTRKQTGAHAALSTRKASEPENTYGSTVARRNYCRRPR